MYLADEIKQVAPLRIEESAEGNHIIMISTAGPSNYIADIPKQAAVGVVALLRST